MNESERPGRVNLAAWDLGPEPGGAPTPPVPRGDGGAVDAGSLVVVTAAVSEEHRTDVVHSALLAQLVADRKHDRHRDAEAWYPVYGDTLERIGWVVKEHSGFGVHRPRRIPCPVETVVLETLEPVSDEKSGELVAAVWKSLAALPDDDRAAVIFEENGKARTAGNFQVLLVDETAGDVVVRLGRFRFRSDRDVPVLRKAKFSARSTVQRGTQILHLNEQVYAPLRDDITAKLASRVDAFVRPVHIQGESCA
ncbi:hypothetical protein ABT121_21630 [Streptomyces sp. NPDC001928]|uniref:hypothetical protein n=1 Tax=Streptomyces sp. NPDC001928 TaxID=3154404 RepID=UPI00332DE3ED